METLLLLSTLQAILGAFDGIYHHEITEKLNMHQHARAELRLHALRSAIYAIVFISLAGLQWQGLLAGLFMLLLAIELIITLADFVIEDKTRDLPASERITHTILTLNFGAILTLFLPIVYQWAGQSTGFAIASHGIYSALMLIFALGVSLMAIREWSAYRQLVKLSSIQSQNADHELLRARKRYLVTGATGFIGQQLCQRLLAQDQQLCVLARDYRKVVRLFGSSHRLSIINSIDQLEKDDHFDAIINLAGEPLTNGIWSGKKKLHILQSRITLTSQLINFMRDSTHKPNVFISGSAIGYYGSQDDTVLTETSASVKSFSSQLCRQWENIASTASGFGVRTCVLRTGLVLGYSGGMLGNLLTPYWYGMGGKMGDGKQWMSWICIEDLLNIIERLVDDNAISGPINATAPNPVTNALFSQSLAQALHRPSLLSVPAWVLRRLLGEAADELFLASTRVIPDRLNKLGFKFKHPHLLPALKGMLSK